MFKTTLRVLAPLALVAVAIPAQATVYNLYQDGFAGGGVVTGSFRGYDDNGDGFITAYGGAPLEVTDFSLSYSGGSIVNSFSISYADLLSSIADGFGGLAYAIGTSTIGFDPSGADGALISFGNIDPVAGTVGSLYAAIYDVSGTGGTGLVVSVLNSTIDTADFTQNPLIVTIPEPGSLALLGLGGMGLMAARRRKA